MCKNSRRGQGQRKKLSQQAWAGTGLAGWEQGVVSLCVAPVTLATCWCGTGAPWGIGYGGKVCVTACIQCRLL